MKQLTVTLLVVVLVGSASTQGQYPNCEQPTLSCSEGEYGILFYCITISYRYKPNLSIIIYYNEVR